MTVSLHPLLQGRYSPLGFDPDHVVTEDEVDVLLEAARWAPSAGNSQPWAFHTARRHEGSWEPITQRLAPSSHRWAVHASLLVVNLAHTHVDGSELEYSEFSRYDLGQAVAHLTLQAQAMGLASRQFRAFDLDGLSADLQVRPGWEIVTLTAIGRPGTGEEPGRSRRPVDDLRDAALAPRGATPAIEP